MNHSLTQANAIETHASQDELERQAYLEELQIDSLQFGVGRGGEPASEE